MSSRPTTATTTISSSLRQKLSSFTSPSAPSSPSFYTTPATFSPTSMGPAKKRGLLASWLRSRSNTEDHGSAYPGYSGSSGASGGGASGASGKGKEREWDAGELDEEMQRIMNAVIFNGGLDFETRPMVVITAAALPDSSRVNYDLLLQLILSYLDLYVEADYSVVFLAAGGRYSPGWSWIWKAYRSLNRKYRKNLKKLYIVHSTGFTKMLFSLAGAIISPKFYSKVEYISTLSDLAQHVPIAQINIHPSVYSENLRYEREIKLPPSQQPASHVFGTSLDELMGLDGESGGTPRPIRDAISYLRTEKPDGTFPLEEQGLFRRSPSSSLLRQVQECYDRAQVVNLAQFGDANLAAVLIKKFFRALPDPIFPDSTFSVIRKCPNPDLAERREDAVEYIRDKIIGELEGNKQVLLNVVFHLLHDVATRSDQNLMDASNLAIVFTPNLVSNENPLKAIQMSMVSSISNKSKDIMEAVGQGQGQGHGHGQAASQAANVVNLPEGPPKHSGTTLGTVVRVCIERYYEIFDEVRDVTEAVPEVDFEEGMIVGGGGGKTPLLAKKGSSPASSINKELSSPSTSPEIATPPSKSATRSPNAISPTTVLPARTLTDHPLPASPSSAAVATPVPVAYKYQARVRGHAGPPPSAASASMALLAKALAEGTPKSPDEHSALLEGGSNSRSYSYAGGATGAGPSDDSPYQFSSTSDVILMGSTTTSSSAPYRAPSVSVRSGTGGGARSGSGWTGGRGLLGMPKTRSIISIDKSPPTVGIGGGGGGDKAFSGRESIKLGRATVTSGGTVRKSSSAGVMGVGVTATGFFTSPH